ncbi:hypothetical protein ACRTEC_16260 [Janibacter indicus]
MFKSVAYFVPVVVSVVLVVIAGSLMPAPAAWLLMIAGPAVAVSLLLGAGERVAAQLLCGARLLTPTEQQALAPAVAILAQRGLGPPSLELAGSRHRSAGVYATGVGRRTVIVSEGLLTTARARRLPPQEIAAVIAHGAVIVRSGAVRNDLALTYWTIPWRLAVLVVAGIGRLLWPMRPLFRGGWMIRALPMSIAIVQTAQEGVPAISAVILALLVTTYAHPWAQRAWARRLQNLGDRGVIEVGVAGPLADFLARFPTTPRLDERTYLLNQHRETAPAAPPHLRLVTTTPQGARS